MIAYIDFKLHAISTLYTAWPFDSNEDILSVAQEIKEKLAKAQMDGLITLEQHKEIRGHINQFIELQIEGYDNIEI